MFFPPATCRPGFLLLFLGASLPSPARAQETIGGGTVGDPALGPAPAHAPGGPGFVLVKNWNFGTSSTSTVKSIADLSAHFQYHDQFGVYNNGGGNYGAHTVAADAATALSGQPVEGTNTGGLKVREFFTDSLKTYLVPLNGATTVHPTTAKGGCGSFVAKWELPNGGSHFKQDLLWETRVRYVTPKYFWFAIWTAGDRWDKGAEMDLIESFGYNNGGGNTNYDGRYWHSSSVGGTDATNYHANWGNAMAARGVPMPYDATQYHIWTWLYRKDNTFSAYVDGREVQIGTMNWTYRGTSTGTPIDMTFLFDGAWGHRSVASVNYELPASDFVGKYYEWDYSRVYLRLDPAAAPIISGYSSQAPGSETAKALDGITNTDTNLWSAKTTGYPQWIEVDLGSDRQINGTQLITQAGRAYRFRVEARATAGGGFQTIVNRQSSTQASPITDSFTQTTARYVRLVVTGAHNYTGNQVGIREFKVAILPTAPTGLAANAALSSRVDLSWVDGVDNETGFRIERKSGAGAFSQIHLAAAGATSFQDTTAQPHTEYIYRIRATNAAGDSPFTSEITATTPTPYDDWAKTAIASPENRGPFQDPDKDGVVNFLERAFAQDPEVVNQVGSPVGQMDGTGYYLLYRRNLAAAELSYIPEITIDLAGTWLSGAEHVTQEVLSTVGNLQTIKATPANPIGDGEVYMRVRVAEPY